MNDPPAGSHGAAGEMHGLVLREGRDGQRPERQLPEPTVLPDEFVLLMPSVAWQFGEKTPWRPAAGYLQAAALRHGSGRVAVFAEAGMFTAQLGGGEPPVRIGFNAPEASQNKQFILNTMRWLAGELPD